MKHPFIKSKLVETCIVCKRPEFMHGAVAVCESCDAVGEVELKNNIAMCASCFDTESKAVVESIPPPVNDTPSILEINNIVRDHEAVTAQNESIEALGASAIKSSEDFFNAKTVAIVERSKMIYDNPSIPADKKHYEVAKFVIADILHLKKVLVEAASIQLEASSQVRANQVYLNTIASKLSQEIRTALHLESPNYEPKKPPSTAPKVKMSKMDKMYESFAKVMGCTPAEAKARMEQQLRNKGIVCTCAATPGMCKVHQ